VGEGCFARLSKAGKDEVKARGGGGGDGEKSTYAGGAESIVFTVTKEIKATKKNRH